mgnify:CR=1 FL=1
MAAIIEEGKVKIFLERLYPYRGPGKRHPGFYNPSLEIDRDLNVIFCSYIAKRGAKKFLDGLAATGIRGIRYAKEVGDIEVDINDYNPKSYEIIKKNIEMNNVEANALNENLCILLQKKRYDYIDIDPYGSPIPFISCMFKALKKKTYVAITATDTATLCGVYKKVCMRKYHSIPLRKMVSKEAGIRILIGYIARQAASFDYGFKPIISYSQGHFFRIYGIMEKGVRKAEESFGNIGWISWEDGWKAYGFKKLKDELLAGPLWIGKIEEKEAIEEMKNIIEEKEIGKKKELKKLLNLLAEEAGLPILYYESGAIAKEMKARQPKLWKIIEELKESGYKAGRTHFMLNAFKSDAPYSIIKGLYK